MQIGATIQTSSMPAGAVAAVTGSNSIVESTINDSEYGLEVNFYSNINYWVQILANLAYSEVISSLDLHSKSTGFKTQ